MMGALLLFLGKDLHLFTMTFQLLKEVVHAVLDVGKRVGGAHVLLHVGHGRADLLSGSTRLLHLAQHVTQLLNLVLVFSQQGILRIFVDSGFVLDLFGAISVPESTEGFIIVVVSWRQGGNHYGLSVAAKGVFQEACEL